MIKKSDDRKFIKRKILLDFISFYNKFLKFIRNFNKMLFM